MDDLRWLDRQRFIHHLYHTATISTILPLLLPHYHYFCYHYLYHSTTTSTTLPPLPLQSCHYHASSTTLSLPLLHFLTPSLAEHLYHTTTTVSANKCVYRTLLPLLQIYYCTNILPFTLPIQFLHQGYHHNHK